MLCLPRTRCVAEWGKGRIKVAGVTSLGRDLSMNREPTQVAVAGRSGELSDRPDEQDVLIGDWRLAIGDFRFWENRGRGELRPLPSTAATLRRGGIRRRL